MRVTYADPASSCDEQLEGTWSSFPMFSHGVADPVPMRHARTSVAALLSFLLDDFEGERIVNAEGVTTISVEVHRVF